MRRSEIMAEESTGRSVDVMETAEKAESTAQKEREESLRRELEEQRRKKRSLVDPLQYECSTTARKWEPEENDLKALLPPTDAQLRALEKAGIFSEAVSCAGEASFILDTLSRRRAAGLATPKQIRLLERLGFTGVGEWSFDRCTAYITQISMNGWRVPARLRG